MFDMKWNILCKIKFNMKVYFALDKINPKFNRVYAISTEIYLLKSIVTILKTRALKIQVTTHHLKSKKKYRKILGVLKRCLIMIIKLLSNVMKIIYYTQLLYQTPLEHSKHNKKKKTRCNNFYLTNE